MAGRKTPKTALVTGANRGIGFEIARQLAEQGITVLAGARSDKKAQAAGAAFAKIGVTVVPVVLDIAAAKRMPAILAEIERRHGPIDVLVNNAAILIDGPGGFGASLFEMTDDTFRRTWETNVLGPATTMRALLPGMIARGLWARRQHVVGSGSAQRHGFGLPRLSRFEDRTQRADTNCCGGSGSRRRQSQRLLAGVGQDRYGRRRCTADAGEGCRDRGLACNTSHRRTDGRIFSG